MVTLSKMDEPNPMEQARFFKSLNQNQVVCQLCPHDCHLRPGQTGRCYVRHNVDGMLYTSSYGRPIGLIVEPIEKKYLFHVWPGARTLSLGTAGCNLGCQYCINWRVSQRGDEGQEAFVTPEAVVEQALAEKVSCIAFTYTEPTIFFEYAEAIALLAKQAGLNVVAKSNGYMTPSVLEAMASWVDALNIDLKGWQHSSYNHLIKGDLSPVLEIMKLTRQLGIWLEISTLLTPGFNLETATLQQMADFIATTLGPETPWHLLRFFPHYQLLTQPPTAQNQLQQAVEIAQKAGLQYIYNKELAQGSYLNTYCPQCGKIIIERLNYQTVTSYLEQCTCPHCCHVIPGRWGAG